MLPPSPVSREQLQKRIESLTQQNKVLKAELDTFKIKCKVVQEENRTLKQASVIIVGVDLYTYIHTDLSSMQYPSI
ncbi:PREDICTED: coiled-coil domain-containing protein 6-like [Rhagoletis zephyria]|uniref:coiled-coil domain-containing protein 6-like n=1 Tax=Rhagoletis zephyria TaxID=28612 RepID=UPI00081190F8|nr:PREDICTED: coiled-coil domain-containing protein 6-like [Rhagoletis zephyria]